jgi:FkbM family methyltransferase
MDHKKNAIAAWRTPFSRPTIPFLLQPYRMANYHPCPGIWRYIRRILSMPPFQFCTKSLFRLGSRKHGTFFFTDQNGKEHRIRFRAGNSQFHSIYFNYCDKGFEPEVATLIDLCCCDTTIFYDIGANWGHHSLYLSSKPNYQGKIYAFEPVPQTFQDLRSIVKQSHLETTIHCSALALSNQTGTQPMSFLDGFSSGSARLSTSTESWLVKIEQLDHLGFPDPDVIKLDAEGEEANILKGGRELLQRTKPWIIFESLRDMTVPKNSLKVFHVLQNLGYVFFEPAFVLREEGRFYAVHLSDVIGKEHQLSFGLFQLPLEKRFLCKGDNFLACHKEKIPELREKLHSRNFYMA